MRGQDNASEYPLAELTPVRDQTNSCADTNSSVTKQSWYRRLSAEKKQEYLLKQRRYRQLKKISPLNFGSLEEPKHLLEQGNKHTIQIFLYNNALMDLNILIIYLLGCTAMKLNQ
jgi:hypothetical protein